MSGMGAGWQAALGIAEIGTNIAGISVSGAGAKRSRQLYEKLQKKQWSREDKAIQRRVKDLKKAGLSPTLALGQPAPSTAAGPVPRSGMEDVGKGLTNLKFASLIDAVTSLQIKKEQRDLLKAQREFQAIKNKQSSFDYDFYKDIGLPSNQTIPNMYKLLKGKSGIIRSASIEQQRKSTTFTYRGMYFNKNNPEDMKKFRTLWKKYGGY